MDNDGSAIDGVADIVQTTTSQKSLRLDPVAKYLDSLTDSQKLAAIQELLTKQTLKLSTYDLTKPVDTANTLGYYDQDDNFVRETDPNKASVTYHDEASAIQFASTDQANLMASKGFLTASAPIVKVASAGADFGQATTTDITGVSGFNRATPDTQTYYVSWPHDTITVQANDPKTTADTYTQPDGVTAKHYPENVTATDLNKTITRTIVVTTPAGQQTQTVQTVKYTLTATVDKVNNSVTYGPWTADGSDAWDAFNVDQIAGYKVKVNGQDPTGANTVEAYQTSTADTSQTINVTYEAQPQTITIRAIYSATSVATEIDLSGLNTQLTGKTDDPVDLSASVDAIKQNLASKGYLFVRNDDLVTKFPAQDQVINLYFNHSILEVSADDPHTTSEQYTQPDGSTKQNYPDGVDRDALNKNLTRTITLIRPNGTKDVVKNTVTYNRNARIDQVTNSVTYDEWKLNSSGPAQWPSYTTPQLAGYTATLATVSAETPTINTPDANIEIQYTANQQKANITYYDDTDSSTLAVVPLTGGSESQIASGAQAKIAEYQKQGYQLVTEEDQIPDTITFDTDDNADQDYTIHFVHGTITVNPSDPKTTDETYTQPDNTTQRHYPDGVASKDLNKNVTRTIKIYLPDGTVKTDTQVVSFERTATIDQVTNEVQYSDWTVKSGSPSSWPRYNAIPSVAGYQASRVFVSPEAVTSDTTDTTVEIRYSPVVQLISLIAFDNDFGNNISWPDGVEQVLKGVTDATITDLPNVLDQLKDKLGSLGYIYDAESTGELPTKFQPGLNSFSFYFVHSKLTVTSDQPKTSQDTYLQPDGKTTNNYPSGVDSNSLVKKVVRTINVHDPHDGVKTTVQTVTFVRNATIDQVSGDIEYTAWKLQSGSDNKWNRFADIPEVPGYTVSQKVVAAKTPSISSANETVDIRYTPQDQTITIESYDQTAHEKITLNGSSASVTGKTDASADLNSNAEAIKTLLAAKGYVFDATASEALPTKFPVGGQTVKLYFTHGTVSVTPDQPKTPSDKYQQPDGQTEKDYPEGVADSDLNKTVTRTIKVIDPHNGEQVTTQKVSFQRTATIDQVTNAVSYGAWELKDTSQADWAEFTTPTVAGYTESQASVAKVTPNAESQDTEVTITYTPQDQTITIESYDQTNHEKITVDGASASVTGQTDASADLNSNAEAIKARLTSQGYVFDASTSEALPTKFPVGGQTVKLYFTHGTVSVTPDQPKTPSDKYRQPDGQTEKDYPEGVAESDLNKTVTRTINVIDPYKGKQVTTQRVSFQRTATIDQVTNAVTYSAWTRKADSQPTWDAFTTPTVAGYEASQTSIAEVTPTAETADEIANITYDAQDQTITLEAYDKSNGNQKLDLASLTTVFNGKTDQTIDLTNNANEIKDALRAKGYQFDGDASDALPTKFTASSQTAKLYFTHGTISVSHDAPKNPTDQYTQPDGKTEKNYPEGVGQTDLNKTVKRTINVTKPDGQVDTTVQQVGFVRDATVDQVTDQVSYTPWRLADETQSQWTKFTSPTLAGYTPSQDEVEAETPDADTPDAVININYSAHQQRAKINYIDDSTNKTLTTDPYHGESEQQIATDILTKVATFEKQGYKLVTATEALPTTITFDTDDNADQTFEVHLTHGSITVEPTDPKQPSDQYMQPDGVTEQNYPDGVAESDLNKTVTRTINVIDPHTGTTTTQQVVSFQRTATIDQVTNAVTYGAWTTKASSQPSWAEFTEIPEVAGYKASQTTIAAKTPTATSENETVDVTYEAEDQSIMLEAYDKTNGNQKLTLPGASATVTAKTDAAINLNSQLDAIKQTLAAQGYEFDATTSEALPTKVPAGGQVVKLYFTHGTISVTPDQPKTPSDQFTQPDGKTDKNYPSGVSESDLNKTVTRTINVTDPHTGMTTTKQVVSFQRTATIDQVTNAVTYGDWTRKPDSKPAWEAFTTPTVSGYTASQTSVAEVTPTAETADEIVNITYDAQAQTITLEAYDKTAGNTKIDLGNLTTVFTGQTDATIDLNPSATAIKTALAAKGYNFDDTSDVLPTKYTDTSQTVKLYFTHNTISVTPDQPKESTDKYTQPDGQTEKNYPEGVAASDLNKTVTRTINVIDPHTGKSTTQQAVSFQRTATIDQVTNAVTYGSWTRKSDSQPTWAAFTTPTVSGYQASQENVAVVTPDVNTQDVTVTITYQAQDQTINFEAYDKSDNDQPITLTGLTTSVTGKTDQEADLATTADAIKASLQAKGYAFDSASSDVLPTKYTDTAQTVKLYFTHNTISVTPDQPKEPTDKYTQPDGQTEKNYPEGVAESDLNKTVTRTIKVTKPDGQVETTVQQVSFQRTATIDQVTNQVTYGQWTRQANSKTSWEAFLTPTIAGYTASQANVAEFTPTVATEDQTVNIRYLAQAQTIIFEAYDKTDQNKQLDLTGLTTVFNGETDEQIDLTQSANSIKTSLAAKGYRFDATTSDALPTKYTATQQTVKLYFTHDTISVTHDAPKTSDDKYPQADGETETNYPAGVAESDLNKTVTRTIKVTNPDGQVETTVQQVSFIRDATIDKVTNQITYTDWRLADAAQNKWSAFTTPVLAGYTATTSSVEEVTPAVTTSDVTINISYTAHEQKATITYIDDQTGATLRLDNFKGDSAQTLQTDVSTKVATFTKQGYQLVTPVADLPTSISFDTDDSKDQAYEVHFTHSKITVTPDNPKKPTETYTQPDQQTEQHYPEGVAESDLNKTVTRTINVIDPHTGKSTTQQAVSFQRTATIDQVTNAVSYSDWTRQADSKSSWEALTAPTVAGYTASQNDVAEVTPTAATADQTIEITYTADAQTATIKFVDVETPTNPVELTKYTLSGKTDDTKLGVAGSQIQQFKGQGYMVKTNPIIDDQLVLSADPDQNVYVIELTHVHETIKPGDELPDGAKFTKHDFERTITRTIHDPENATSPTVQSATFGRDVVYDKVTGQILESESAAWKKLTGSWDEYQATGKAGYTTMIDGQAAVQVPADTTIDQDTKDAVVNITYVANEQVATIKFLDASKLDQTGQPSLLDSYTLTGKTDEVKTDVAKAQLAKYTSRGYLIQTNPIKDDTITLHADPAQNVYTIILTHEQVSVVPGDELPTGVKFDQDSYERTVTRSIYDVTDPANRILMTTQTVHFGRNITYDKVTGEIIAALSGEWTNLDSSSPATSILLVLMHASSDQGTWAEFVPTRTNYTLKSIDGDASQQVVEAETVHHDSSDRVVEVVFERNDQTTTIKLIDQTQGQPLQEIPVTAKPGQVVPVPSLEDALKTYTDKGYQLVDNPVINGQVTIGESDAEVTITLEHGTRELKPGDELPTGVNFTKDAYDKTVKRTVMDNTYPANPQVLTVQSVNFGRTITYDLVTGDIIDSKSTSWTPASARLEAYTPTKTNYVVAAIDGDATKRVVDAKTVSHESADDVVYVVFAHATSEKQVEKTITRKVTITTPGGQTKTVEQTITFQRTETEDQVTGQITYGEWTLKPGSKDRFEKISVPNVPGYTASQTKIPEVTVTPDTTEEDVTITYTKNVVAKTKKQQPKLSQHNQESDKQSTRTEAKKLPQTGESNNAILGLILTAFSLGLFALKKKEDD